MTPKFPLFSLDDLYFRSNVIRSHIFFICLDGTYILYSYSGTNLVTSMKITKKEVNWSLDIKRSVVMMMQLRLQNDDTLDVSPSYNDLEQNNYTSFQKMEVSSMNRDAFRST